MSIELTYLTYAALLTGLMWVPYILNLLAVRGIVDAVGYPLDPKPIAAWAQRLKAAHYNAVENLVVFAALILVAHAAGISGEATQVSAATYFWARVVHAVAYTFAIPWVRTIAFAVGIAAELCIAWHILF